ncbi:unnamed protein product [Moneuplotes crassus]|uniref:Uncharacterized protein n=1 Tax=Euplotes crassus TaxID=5936 RepID=A0AAD1UPN5_EUPCR|nr:unnamed protein product [Moneuplotes crassus]
MENVLNLTSRAKSKRIQGVLDRSKRLQRMMTKTTEGDTEEKRKQRNRFLSPQPELLSCLRPCGDEVCTEKKAKNKSRRSKKHTLVKSPVSLVSPMQALVKPNQTIDTNSIDLLNLKQQSKIITASPREERKEVETILRVRGGFDSPFQPLARFNRQITFEEKDSQTIKNSRVAIWSEISKFIKKKEYDGPLLSIIHKQRCKKEILEFLKKYHGIRRIALSSFEKFIEYFITKFADSTPDLNSEDISRRIVAQNKLKDYKSVLKDKDFYFFLISKFKLYLRNRRKKRKNIIPSRMHQNKSSISTLRISHQSLSKNSYSSSGQMSNSCGRDMRQSIFSPKKPATRQIGSFFKPKTNTLKCILSRSSVGSSKRRSKPKHLFPSILIKKSEQDKRKTNSITSDIENDIKKQPYQSLIPDMRDTLIPENITKESDESQKADKRDSPFKPQKRNPFCRQKHKNVSKRSKFSVQKASKVKKLDKYCRQVLMDNS